MPDVIGRVTGLGRILPSAYCNDPTTTWRCERASVGDRIYLNPALALSRTAEDLSKRYQTQVVVGSQLGGPWLAEVEDYEAGHPGPAGPRVVWLAPPGTVQPSWVNGGVPPSVAGRHHEAAAMSSIAAPLCATMSTPGRRR